MARGFSLRGQFGQHPVTWLRRRMVWSRRSGEGVQDGSIPSTYKIALEKIWIYDLYKSNLRLINLYIISQMNDFHDSMNHARKEPDTFLGCSKKRKTFATKK